MKQLLLKIVTCNALLFFLIFTPVVSFGQFEIKTLVQEKNATVNYYKNENYLVFLIDTKHTPFIYTDINRNHLTDPYIDKLFSVSDRTSLCVANKLENDATTTCGQSTRAILLVNKNRFQFIIPKNELTYTPSEPIYISFGVYDKENKVVYSINNKGRSYIIE
jgi:hypothetical protein